MMPEQGSGLLLPVFSLPSRFGIGDAGPAAFDFIDRLAAAGQRYWQILPLNPPSVTSACSPYHAVSSFALNPLFISPEILVRDGLICERDLSPIAGDAPPSIDYPEMARRKMLFLRDVAESAEYGRNDPNFDDFTAMHQHWLDDYAVFSALQRSLGEWWPAWPSGLRDRTPEAMKSLSRTVHTGIAEIRYLQYLIFTQWAALKAYCMRRGIRLIGDLPMFPAHESADVWVHRDLFRLADNGLPLAVAGVPPDYFSPDGQRWGNPVYDWEEVEKEGFSWWIERVQHNLRFCDLLRIDHFRGFCAYWEIPAGSADSRDGRWVAAPGRALLAYMAKLDLPILAEDLGVITPDVRQLMDEFRIPGMRVLQFGFDGDLSNPHAPENIGEGVVLYTGTHDNNTLRGWFTEETGPEERKRIAAALESLPLPGDLPREMIRLAMESRAQAVIIPVQDLLGLPSQARMNRPGTTAGNWQWRLPRGLPTPGDWDWLGAEASRTGRDARAGPREIQREKHTPTAGDRYSE